MRPAARPPDGGIRSFERLDGTGTLIQPTPNTQSRRSAPCTSGHKASITSQQYVRSTLVSSPSLSLSVQCALCSVLA